jgi:ATP-dependent helicase/nuclease subunit B
MPIRYIIGRAGTGKTARCLEEIRDALRREPEGPPLVLIVPEQATFQAEYALVSTPGLGGSIRAQVLSFRRLAFRVMQEAGGLARIHIDDSGKKMLLYDLLHQHEKELKHFRSSAGQIGFVDSLNRMFREFRHYCITPDKLEQFVRKLDGAAGAPAAAAAAASGAGEAPAGDSGVPGTEGAHETNTAVSGTDGARETNALNPTADKLRDLLFLYKRFEERLASRYTDSDHLLAKTAEAIPESAFAREAVVWIDGFYGFTPQELQIVGQLMQFSRHVTVTLGVDRDYGADEEPDELDPFHPTARALVRLKRLAAQLGIAEEPVVRLDGPPPRFAQSPMLAHLERSLVEIGARPYRGTHEQQEGKGSKGVFLAAAVNRRAEAEGVARDIIRLVRDEGCRWRDIAVMVRDLESYGDVLAVTFADYNIPYFLDQKRTVLHHPAVELVRSALEAVIGRWHNDAVFRCVKTELLFPIGVDEDPDSAAALRDAMCRLENYVLAAGIQGYRWTEPRRWTYRVGSMLDDVQESAMADADEAFYEEIDRLRQMIVRPLSELEDGLRKAGTVREMAEALYRFLERLDVPGKLERWSRDCLEQGRPEKAREHAQVWSSLVDLLDQIVEMMGDERIDPDRLAGIVDAGLESVKLGLVPPSLDQVLVGSMDRTRSGTVRHLFVLGANDGVLPARPKEDGVLSEPEREKLIAGGLELAEGSRRQLLDETFLLYAALTVPSESVRISYPLADEEGKTMLPSEMVKRIRSLFPNVREKLLMNDPPVGETQQPTAPDSDPYEYIAHPERALSHLAVQLRHWMRGLPIADVWWEVYNRLCADPNWRERLRRTLGSLLFTNRVEPLPPDIGRRLYGELLQASVSRMERFVACPFSQFASHGLKLVERRVYRLDAPDIGQLFHAALSRVALEIERDGADWGAMAPEQLAERASRAVDELAPRLQGEILLSSKRYGYIARKLKQIVGRAAVVLGVHARMSEFVPVGLEVGFGPGQPLPALEFRLDNGSRMEIVGRIDRVDRAASEHGVLLRVIDYKSSDTALSLADVYYGMSLQMLTYLDVVITHAERWIGERAKPAGVLYFHVHNPLLVRKNSLSPEEAEAQLLKRFKMKGLVLEDAETVRLMDRSLRERNGHSQFIPVALKADGGFYKQSSVASEAKWERLRQYVRGMIRSIGNGIAEGRVDVRPIRLGPKLACTRCPYKPVCQFEPLFEGNDYMRLPRIEKEAVWQAIETAAQGAAEAAAGTADT